MNSTLRAATFITKMPGDQVLVQSKTNPLHGLDEAQAPYVWRTVIARIEHGATVLYGIAEGQADTAEQAADLGFAAADEWESEQFQTVSRQAWQMRHRDKIVRQPLNVDPPAKPDTRRGF